MLKTIPPNYGKLYNVSNVQDFTKKNLLITYP